MMEFRIIEEGDLTLSETDAGWKRVENFKSKRQVVDYCGKSYQIISKDEKRFSGSKRFGRVLGALLATICTLGLALISKSVRNFFSKNKIAVRYGVEYKKPKDNPLPPPPKPERQSGSESEKKQEQDSVKPELPQGPSLIAMEDSKKQDELSLQKEKIREELKKDVPDNKRLTLAFEECCKLTLLKQSARLELFEEIMLTLAGKLLAALESEEKEVRSLSSFAVDVVSFLLRRLPWSSPEYQEIYERVMRLQHELNGINKKLQQISDLQAFNNGYIQQIRTYESELSDPTLSDWDKNHIQEGRQKFVELLETQKEQSKQRLEEVKKTLKSLLIRDDKLTQ